MARAEPKLAEGTVIGGRYRVEAWIGEGAMASVARAKHLRTGKTCALKLVHPHLVTSPEFVDMFLKEAQVGARIGPNPYIVDVFDADIDQVQGVPYLAMELLEGEPLDCHLAACGPMPPAVVRVIFRQLAEALDQAHAAGVIHRDLKPSNLFLTRDRQGLPAIKVVDFGIAKVLEQEVQHTATQVGSPAYAAPEQLGPILRKLAAEHGITLSVGVSPATDVWALGLVSYEVLTGLPPGQFWRRGSSVALAELLVTVALEDPPPATQRAGERAHLLPSNFDDWFACCLQKNARDRWSTAGAAVSHLVHLLDQGVLEDQTTVQSASVQRATAHPTAAQPRRTPSVPDLSIQVQTQLIHDERFPSAPDLTFPLPTRVLPAVAKGLPAVQPISPDALQIGLAETRAQPTRRKGSLAVALVAVALIGLALFAFFFSLGKEGIGGASPPPAPVSLESSSNSRDTGFSVTGSQPGVRVFVDGVEKGPLPLRITDITPGVHTIRFDAGDRYQALERTVEVETGIVKDLGVLQLKVLRGQIAIVLATPDAAVTLVQEAPNGLEKRLPITDWRNPPVKVDVEGSGWKLVATKNGYQDFIQTISFDDGVAEKAIRISLTSQSVAAPTESGVSVAVGSAKPEAGPTVQVGTATLHISSIPATEIFLDDTPLGSTPKTISVRAGLHIVTFVHADMGERSLRVTLAPGESKNAVVRF